MKLIVNKLHQDAILPTKVHNTDAGIDLYSIEDVTINLGETVKIRTGISVQLEDTLETYAQKFLNNSKYNLVNLLWDRSGLGSKGIHRMAGVIDFDYRGEILVCLTNLNMYHFLSTLPNILYRQSVDNIDRYKEYVDSFAYHIPKGSKICQMLVQTVVPVTIEEGVLTSTERGNKGFGSSGT